MGKKELTTIDLFAGGGGLSLGFANAGFEIIAAFDNWQPALAFYKRNIPEHPIYEINLSDKKAIKAIRDLKPNVIIGGPPCQDFSSAGKRDESMGRANLTITFANIVKSVFPDWFLMENVDRAVKCKTYIEAMSIFEKAGYKTCSTILDASLCGVPQKRKRAFLFGDKEGKSVKLKRLLLEDLAENSITLRDYFGNSLGIEHYYRHPRSYKRRGVFSIDEPSPTIRGVNRPIPSGYPGHNGDTSPINAKVRPLTTKERSIIQTFPEDFDLEGNKSDIEQIIGNAVPVKLAEYVACKMFSVINNLETALTHTTQGKRGQLCYG